MRSETRNEAGNARTLYGYSARQVRAPLTEECCPVEHNAGPGAQSLRSVGAAQAFARQAQTQRCQQWLTDFERDLRQLAAVPDPTDADVERIFADTVVPSSRAVAFVRQLAAQPAGTVSGEIAYQGRVFLYVHDMTRFLPVTALDAQAWERCIDPARRDADACQ